MLEWVKSLVRPSTLHEAGIIGLNKRNFGIISRYNKRNLYPLVDNKVQTKLLANKLNVNTPGLIGLIEFQFQVKDLRDIIRDYREFVIKPAHGSAGRGVLVITDYSENRFITASNRVLSFDEVYQHISNILSGLYSLGGQYDIAIIEELVHFSPRFKGFSFQGVPDVRVIVYQGYPVMAMMRLSTRASGGRANLHQGAVGVGLDIKTGKALHAVMRDRPVTRHPDTDVSLQDLEVPDWREHLEIAAKGYEMTGLGYLGADIVLDEFRGPMLLELNARPGLAIQIANRRGLGGVLKNIDKHCRNRLPEVWEERLQWTLDSRK
jgi:alpha-L-glutamate ligase-like protein